MIHEQEADKQMNINLLQRGKSVTASHKFCDCSGILVRLIARRDIQPSSEGHMALLNYTLNPRFCNLQ